MASIIAKTEVTHAEQPLKPQPVLILDLKQLADVTGSDPMVNSRATRLRYRRVAGLTTGTLGSIIGGVFVVASIVLGHEAIRGDVAVKETPNVPMLATGLGVLTIGWLTCAVIWPPRSSIDDVVREWNERHPDRFLRFSP